MCDTQLSTVVQKVRLVHKNRQGLQLINLNSRKFLRILLHTIDLYE